jgi:hypothetical protein
MPATVSQVLTGLATRLGTISGLRTYTYMPDQLNPPVGFPVLESVEYHKAFGGGDVRMQCSVFVIVGRYIDRTAHAALDGFLSYDGATSIRAAIEGDRTLGGVARTLIVESGVNISAVSVAEAEFLQVQCTVVVHA